MTVTIDYYMLAQGPLRLGRGQNDRGHWGTKHKLGKAETIATGWLLKGKPKPPLPCVVTLTRLAPSAGLDDDNLVGSLKAVRDAVAEWIGVDDAKSDVVRYECAQAREPWGVRIEIRAATC